MRRLFFCHALVIVCLLCASTALAAKGGSFKVGINIKIKYDGPDHWDLASYHIMPHTEASFPQVYYLMADAASLQALWITSVSPAPGTLEQGIPSPYYLGYFVLGPDFSLSFTPKGGYPLVNHHYHEDIEECVRQYNKCVQEQRKGTRKGRRSLFDDMSGHLDGPYAGQLLHFVRFIDRLWTMALFTIQDVPGDPPDDGFVPRFSQGSVIHTQAEAEALTAPFEKLEDTFLVNKPVNLKPGMRLILPEKPAQP